MIRKVVRAVLFALPVLFLLPHLAQFPFQPGSQYSDLLVSHYPNGITIQNSLREWHTVPLWSPYILSGYPFAANPLSGLYYLPGLLALLFPLPLGFNLLTISHIIFGGVGMYLFLRAEGLLEAPALFGGLVFEALPKVFGHIGSGHLTLVYAVAWTPWLLLAERRSTGMTRLRWMLPGLVLGLIVLADVRWAAYSGLLWLAYSLRCHWLGEKDLPRPSSQRRLSAQAWGGWLGVRLVNVLFALLIAAPLLLPLAEYTTYSTRSLMRPNDALTLSLPPSQLVGLLFPNFAGSAEWVLYPGMLVLALVLYVLGSPYGRQRTAFWLVVVLVSLMFALGSSIPLMDWLIRLPGLSLLRVPPRALFLTGFGLSIIAAYGLEHLYTSHADRAGVIKDRAGLLLFAVTAFAVLFAVAVLILADQPLARIQIGWGGLFLLLATCLIFVGRAHRLTRGALTVLLFLIALVDLIGVDALSLDFRSSTQVFGPDQPLADYLLAEGGKLDSFRVYSPSYSLPQHVSAANRLELSDGVDPLQLRSYVEFMSAATGVPVNGYSVTLPPYAETGDPRVDNLSYSPDAGRLGLLNVRYVVSAFPLETHELLLKARIGDTRVYENPLVLPRAWVQPAGAALGEQVQPVNGLSTRPNWVSVKASGPGLLVLSELAYPGWDAYVDGRLTAVETVGGLLRGVMLEAGAHTVQFVFQPERVYIGLALAGLAWMALIMAVWVERSRYA